MILGIDFGTSTTDYAVMEGRRVVEHGTLPSPATLAQVTAQVRSPYRHLACTGAGSARIRKGTHIDEIRAIGRGGLLASGKRAGLVVSIGSGTAMVSCRRGRTRHIGGTAIGARTLQGLGKLLLGTDDVARIAALAAKGDPSRVDILLRDVYPHGIGLLPPDATVAHFGAVTTARKADLALGLITLCAETIGTLAVFGARAEKQQTIIITGKLITLPMFRHTIATRIGAIYHATVVVPQHAPVATAIGAAASRS